MRSHPSTELVPEVWGWRPAAAALHCRTAKENKAAPHRLRRQGGAPHPSELRVEWRPARLPAAAAAGPHSVGIREHGSLLPFRWAAAAAPTVAVLRDLPSGTAYEV
jgi:hypothetical protein